MTLYANLLGKWTKLSNFDSINSSGADFFVHEILENFNADELSDYLHKNKEFLLVTKDSVDYNIHYSQIQWTNESNN